MNGSHYLEEKLRKRIHGQWYGQLESIFSGGGVSVDEMRPWQQGDSQRAINWKLTAKHDELWVNTYEALQGAQVDLLLDRNDNWLAGVTQPNWEIVSDFLVDYALYAQTHGLYTSVWDGGAEDTHQKIITNAEWRALLHEWSTRKPTGVYKSILTDWLHTQTARSKRRVLLVISDFLTPEEGRTNILDQLDRRHVVVTLRLPVPDLVGTHYLK